MDEQTAEALLDQHFPTMVEFLGLGDWTVHVEFRDLPDCNPETFPPSDDREAERTGGFCKVDANYREATITLDAASIVDADDFCRLLFHELLHVVCGPFNLYREGVRAALMDPKQFYILDAQWVTAAEHTLLALERIFWRSMRLDPTNLGGEP